jgi:hypothetical protein
VTDFGACRSVTDEAAAMLKQSQSALETMRNGDWKEETADSRGGDTVLKVLGAHEDTGTNPPELDERYLCVAR